MLNEQIDLFMAAHLDIARLAQAWSEATTASWRTRPPRCRKRARASGIAAGPLFL